MFQFSIKLLATATEVVPASTEVVHPKGVQLRYWQVYIFNYTNQLEAPDVR
jgi:hypothetical protein